MGEIGALGMGESRELERCRTFLEMTGDSFFEYDARSGELKVFLPGSDWGRPVRPGLSRENAAVFMAAFTGSEGGVDADFLLRDGSGTRRWYHICARGERSPDGGLIRILGAYRDIQRRKEAEQSRMAYESRLRERAVYDGVTRLLNRAATEEMVNMRLSGGGDGKNVCLVVDIDDFKRINDACGHVFGDLVLREVSAELKNCCRPFDVAGRIGGDEFFLMFCGVPDVFDARGRQQRLVERVSGLTEKLGSRQKISVSVGMAVADERDRTFKDVYARADRAMYRAKALGKNQGCQSD